MKELSTEIINIDGVDYTLFLNRKGIVAWEKFTKSESERFAQISEKYQEILNNNAVENFDGLDNDTDPFEGLEEIDNLDSDIEYMNRIYSRLYWILLYTNHKLSISDARELYNKACDEYGNEQVILLARQMVDEVNSEPKESKQLKNLAALKPTKK
jgi:hypothetical protein